MLVSLNLLPPAWIDLNFMWMNLTLMLQDCPNVMEKIQSYLDDSSVSPLVVHGDSGTGKSFLVACAVSKLRERNPRQKKCTVVRFVGLTPRSSSIKRLLAGICEQVISQT